MFRPAIADSSQCFRLCGGFRHFGDDVMMSSVIVLSTWFFCSLTRFKWLQFLLDTVNDSAFLFILKLAVSRTSSVGFLRIER